MAVGWIGKQKNGISVSTPMPAAGTKAVSRYQNTTGIDLIITTLTGFWDTAWNPITHVMGVAYTDVASLPGALVATTTEVMSPGANPHAVSRLQFSFPIPWVWPAGAYRWLGFIADQTITVAANNCDTVTGGVKFNSNPYLSGPTDPFGASPFSTDVKFRLWAEGYDGLHKLGRVSIQDGKDISASAGQYYALDPHFERFTLGGEEAPVGAVSFISVQSIWVYVTTDTAAKAHCAIYANDGTSDGTPVNCTKLGETEEVTGMLAGWMEFPFTDPLVLAASGVYWLATTFDIDGTMTNVAGFGGRLSSAGASQTNPAFYDFPVHPDGSYAGLIDQRPFGLSIYAAYTLGEGVGSGAPTGKMWIG